MKVKKNKIDNSVYDVKTLNHGFRVFDFLRLGFISIAISTILVIGSIIIMLTKGFTLGQDFTGGTTVEMTVRQDASLDSIRQTLSEAGYNKATVQLYKSDSINKVQDIVITQPIEDDSNKDASMTNNQVAQNIAKLVVQKIDGNAKEKRVAYIGPSVGSELATKGTLAIIISLIGIMIYVGFRFEWRFGMSAVIGLGHDVIITCGYLSLFSRELDLTIIAALLSVIGYSLNDTIVVFDRIRENFTQLGKGTSHDIINVSLTQTLRRTLMTSGTTLLVVVILFIFGGPMLKGFSETLFVGIVLGTISSIYVSAYLAFKFGINRSNFEHEQIKPEGADFDMSKLQ